MEPVNHIKQAILEGITARTLAGVMAKNITYTETPLPTLTFTGEVSRDFSFVETVFTITLEPTDLFTVKARSTDGETIRTSFLFVSIVELSNTINEIVRGD